MGPGTKKRDPNQQELEGWAQCHWKMIEHSVQKLLCIPNQADVSLPSSLGMSVLILMLLDITLLWRCLEK